PPSPCHPPVGRGSVGRMRGKLKFMVPMNAKKREGALSMNLCWFGVPPLTQSMQLKGSAPASGAVVGALANHSANVAPGSLFGDWQCRGANRRGRRLAAPEAGALPNAYCMDWAEGGTPNQPRLME